MAVRSAPLRACLAMALAFGQARADGSALDQDLTQASLEQLMEIRVTSVARKGRSLARTAAAVYVITAEDIRRSTAASIPELLRMVPGLNVARINNSQWAVSARGFNNRFSNKLLVLMDGRSVYSPLYSGVYWEVQDTLLEDIERIEVIRGPGATVWGANAVNGVINIITKKAADTRGGLVVAGGGQHEQSSAAMRYGGRAGRRLDYRIWAKGFRRSNLRNERGGPSTDAWNAERGGVRADWTTSDTDTLTVAGTVYQSRTGETLAVNPADGSGGSPAGGYSRTRGHVLQADWHRARQDGSHAELSLSHEAWIRSEAIASGRVDTFDLDYHAGRVLGRRQEVHWGLGARLARDRVEAGPAVSFQPRARSASLFSAFIQDEVALSEERVWLTAGTKIEHNDYTGIEIQPSVQLLWTPSDIQSVWASAARAVRTPSRSEHDIRYNLGTVMLPGGLTAISRILGDRDFNSEILLAHEGGYRIAPAPWLSLDGAVFYNRYRQLNTIEAGLPVPDPTGTPALIVPLRTANKARGEVYGAELAAQWRARPYWRLQAGSSWLRMNLHRAPDSLSPDAEIDEGRSPRRQGQLASLLDLPRGFSLDAYLYAYGQLPAAGVPGYAKVDLRLGWRPRKAVEASIAVENLGGGEHLEFQPEFISRGHLVRRAVYGKITYRF